MGFCVHQNNILCICISIYLELTYSYCGYECIISTIGYLSYCKYMLNAMFEYTAVSCKLTDKRFYTYNFSLTCLSCEIVVNLKCFFKHSQSKCTINFYCQIALRIFYCCIVFFVFFHWIIDDIFIPQALSYLPLSSNQNLVIQGVYTASPKLLEQVARVDKGFSNGDFGFFIQHAEL